MVEQISDDTFENEVIKSSTPYLVEFWATWSAPCTMMAATVEAIEEQQRERLRAGRMNVDDNPDIVERFDVQGVPTLLFFVGGKVAEKFVGLVPKADIENTIEIHLQT